MTVFARTMPEIGKRQTKLYLTDEAFAKLKETAARTGMAMSVVVETLIRDHCHLAEDAAARNRRTFQ